MKQSVIYKYYVRYDVSTTFSDFFGGRLHPPYDLYYTLCSLFKGQVLIFDVFYMEYFIILVYPEQNASFALYYSHIDFFLDVW